MESNWASADPLDYAWLVYGPPELANRYRDSGKDRVASALIRQDLRMLLRDQLASGEVMALGARPALSDKPVKIPKMIFLANNSKIDWGNESVTALGQSYEGVTVCLPPAGKERRANPITKAQSAARGRKSHSPLLEEAYQALERDHENFPDWSMEKQMLEICTKAGELHPGRFQGKQPGRSTVYRFLANRTKTSSVP